MGGCADGLGGCRTTRYGTGADSFRGGGRKNGIANPLVEAYISTFVSNLRDDFCEPSVVQSPPTCPFPICFQRTGQMGTVRRQRVGLRRPTGRPASDPRNRPAHRASGLQGAVRVQRHRPLPAERAGPIRPVRVARLLGHGNAVGRQNGRGHWLGPDRFRYAYTRPGLGRPERNSAESPETRQSRRQGRI